MPKIYFVDTGLLCYFLGIDSSSALERHPLRGSIFETFIFSEILKTLSLDARRSRFFFFRTHDGQEIDFIIERGCSRIGIEAKYSDAVQPHDARHLHALRKNDLLTEALLVSTSEQFHALSSPGFRHIAWHALSHALQRPTE